MTNHEIVDKVKAAVDSVTRLAEQYTWQSAAITGKNATTFAPVLMQMAINELLRAELIAVVLVRLGYQAISTDSPKERIQIGKNTEEMLEFDRKGVRENIVLCEDVLAHHPEAGNMGCPVQELFEELCREEREQLDLLDELQDRSSS